MPDDRDEIETKAARLAAWQLPSTMLSSLPTLTLLSLLLLSAAGVRPAALAIPAPPGAPANPASSAPPATPVIPATPATPLMGARAAAAGADPRPILAALQLANRTREALVLVQEEQAERPAAGRQIGLDFLRGHLLEQLGRPADSVPAFVDAISATPKLALHSRYRLAAEQMRLGHPEVAAGLLATGLAAQPSSPLAPEAVRLLVQSLARGGDCRLLRGFHLRPLATPERRELQLAQA
ncbi:MAG: hypothetical protein JOZ15_14455, partial [Acidobacteria bacterium]|nr:hypothetical protein [Acidobacteriota bacterium]